MYLHEHFFLLLWITIQSVAILILLPRVWKMLFYYVQGEIFLAFVRSKLIQGNISNAIQVCNVTPYDPLVNAVRTVLEAMPVSPQDARLRFLHSLPRGSIKTVTHLGSTFYMSLLLGNIAQVMYFLFLNFKLIVVFGILTGLWVLLAMYMVLRVRRLAIDLEKGLQFVEAISAS